MCHYGIDYGCMLYVVISSPSKKSSYIPSYNLFIGLKKKDHDYSII